MIFSEQVRLFQQTLFSNFPREVGFPARRLVHSFDDFLNLAHQFHISSPVFIQLYNVISNKVNIEKAWIDFDGPNQFELLYELKTAYFRLIDLGFNENEIVIAFSGKKGYHLYAMLNSTWYEQNTAKELLHYILSYVCRDLKTPDSPLFGDVNRIVRVAGIQRPEGTLMLIINPKELFLYSNINDYFADHEYQWNKLIEIGNQYLKKINGGAKTNLKKLKDKIQLETKFKPPKQNKIITKSMMISQQKSITTRYNRGGEYNDFLKRIIKNDALYYTILAPNPVHKDRIRLALKLMRTGLNVDDCTEIISTLNWMDFEDKTTRFYLNDIKGRYL